MPYPYRDRQRAKVLRPCFLDACFAEALLIADFDEQQAILESEKEEEESDVYPVTVCLSSVDLAPSATHPPGVPNTAVKNQYTFAQLVKTSRRSSSASASSLASVDSAEGRQSFEEDRLTEWRCQVVKQKIQFGNRTFEVQVSNASHQPAVRGSSSRPVSVCGLKNSVVFFEACDRAQYVPGNILLTAL